jgi:membrane protein YqaA with SNARE-associated domain
LGSFTLAAFVTAGLRDTAFFGVVAAAVSPTGVPVPLVSGIAALPFCKIRAAAKAARYFR